MSKPEMCPAEMLHRREAELRRALAMFDDTYKLFDADTVTGRTTTEPATSVLIQEDAGNRLGEIMMQRRQTRGDEEAEAYIRRLFALFEAIVERRFPWHGPFAFSDGYLCCPEEHYICWRALDNGGVGIVAILDESLFRF